MEQVIAYAKLLFPFALNKVQKEVNQLQAEWTLHFNSRHYEGQWTVVSLRAPGGDSSAIIPDRIGAETYANTLLLDACPSIKEIINSFQCPVMSVRLLNLKKGAMIKEHRDAELSFEKGEARLHFPVFTNDKVMFSIDKELVQMQAGECWYMNANLPHNVINSGETDRVHLVIDCMVNDWLRNVFVAAEKTYAKQQTALIEKMIAELRLQNTDTANNLADELENTLDQP